MRLIDAERLFYNLERGVRNASNEVFREIAYTPTVKAIPIEWILKWACEFIDPNSEGYKMAMELVHDWRKENEKDI